MHPCQYIVRSLGSLTRLTAPGGPFRTHDYEKLLSYTKSKETVPSFILKGVRTIGKP